MSSPIVISILANASQANAQLKNTAGLAQRTGDRFRSMAGPAALALGAITLGAKSAVDAASDLQENVAKTGEIFGDQAGGIEKFAERAEQALGQSKTAALDAASTFGIMGEKAGLSGKDTAAFSKQFVTLASDLASFNNTSPEEAVVAIGSAMRGEAEPIRKYGVLLDDATLRARALKEGLIDNIKTALTPQQKALAASKEILAQTSKAQGDFARTSSGAANQARINAAETENLKAKLGDQLLPAYERLQRILSSVLGFLAQHKTATQILVAVVAGLAVGVLAVNAAMAVAGAATAVYTGVTNLYAAAQTRATAASLGTRIGLAALAVQTYAVAAAQRIAAAAQLALNLVMSANPLFLLIAGLTLLVGGLIYAYTHSERFRAVVQKVFGFIKSFVIGAVSTVVGFVRNHWRLLVSILGGPIGIAVALISRHWGRITAGVRTMVSAVRGRFGDLVGFVRAIPSRILSALGNVGSMLLNAGRAIISGLISGVTQRLGALYDKVAGIGAKIKSLKGPLSYDKVMLRDEGQAIIGGLIDGIAAQEDRLYGRVRNISRNLARSRFAVGAATIGADPTGGTLAAAGRANITNVVNISLRLDSTLTEAQMGAEMSRAISAAKRQGLVPA